MDRKPIGLIKKIIIVCIVFVLGIFALQLIPGVMSENNKIYLNAATWSSSLVQLDKNDSGESHLIDLKDLVTVDANGLVTEVKNPEGVIRDGKEIMLVDGLDVYYFSEVCNPKLSSGEVNPYYKKYLTFDYCLGADINYEDASRTYKMLRPVGWSVPFSGTFNGREHTISNIFFRAIESETEYQDNFVDIVDGETLEMHFFSLFSQNSGTITNLGIIDANMIQYDIFAESLIFASILVGNNQSTGEVLNCYIQDFRGNSAGLSAEGGFEIATFVNNNDGLIKNAYVAVDRITSTSVSLTDATMRQPFISGNDEGDYGELVNCYYDAQILIGNNTYESLEIDGLKGIVTADFTDPDKFNYSDGVWFSNVTYEAKYSSYLKLTYPILKGFNIHEESGVKYFKICTPEELVYMFELCNQYQVFREADYMLMNTIDMLDIKQGSYGFGRNVFSGTFVGGPKANDYNPTLVNGQVSTCNSILNYTIDEGISYNGYHCYGFFGVLAGTVENINFINLTINQNDLKDNYNYLEKNAIGSVCGILEGGEIDNVHVYSDITLSDGTNTYLGTEYVGGICGLATKGTITDSTTNGTIVGGAKTVVNNYTDYEDSSSIGGILGRAENNDGVINCLNGMDIEGFAYSTNPGINLSQFIGGVIGSGNLNNTYRLQNNGNLYVGVTLSNKTYSNSLGYYSKVYIGGVIGLANSSNNANGQYFNNGDIYYYVDDNNYKAYISGVVNVISDYAITLDTFNANLNANTVINNLNSQKDYVFSSLTNGGTLHIENELANSRYPTKLNVVTAQTNTIDIRAAGVMYSYLTNIEIDGAYNLDYHYDRNTGTKIDNTAQSIDISMMDEYAPVINSDNLVTYLNNVLHLDTNYLHSTSTTFAITDTKFNTYIDVKKVYNYRDTYYITNNEVLSYTLQLSGCLNGRNFNVDNLRNDGDVKVYITNSTTGLRLNQSPYYNYFGDYKKLKVYGCLEEVSLGCTAKNVYNGGNITISSDGYEDDYIVNFNLYIAGICYKNVGNDPASQQDLMIESGYEGSLHNSVNNGEIRITSGDILTGSPTVAGAFYGVSRVGGICAFNASTISSTFNLGNIYNINYIQTVNNYGSYWNPDNDYNANFEVETGGFCFGQQNEVYNTNGDYTRANIIDSANNGTIVSMNPRDENVTWVNAAGFVARNDRCEDGNTVDQTNTSENPHQQKIEYSINYGDIYSYNAYDGDNLTTSNEPQAKAAGFVCLGACTIVDVINYGNVYCNKVAGGMFGHIYFNRMTAAGASATSPVYIANAINYGNVDLLNISNAILNLLYTVDHTTAILESYINDVHTTSAYSDNYPVGALIGMIYGRGNNYDDLSALNIKNLINFYDPVDIIGRTASMDEMNSNNNELTVKRTTLQYMATTKANDYSPEPFATSGTSYGIKCYYKDTTEPNNALTDIFSQNYNGGIFNENYVLRTIIPLRDANGNIVEDKENMDMSNTDNFINDYIQFVPYSKVNDYLVDKIGLDDVVFDAAIANAQKSYYIINGLLAYKQNNGTNPAANATYNTLIANYNEKLNSEKEAIVEAIRTCLKSYPVTSETEKDLEKILDVLLDNETASKAILDDSDVISLLNKLLYDMNDDNVNALMTKIVSDKDLLTELIINYPGVLEKYINEYASDANITTEETALIVEMFGTLIQNDDAINEYVNSLTDAQKETLSSELYALVGDNEIVQNAFGKLITSIDLTTNAQLTTLTDLIFGNDSTVEISDTEVNTIFDEMIYEEIGDLTLNELTTLIQDMQVINGDLYNFIENGRTASSEIFLPATRANHLAVVNATNHSIQTIPATEVSNATYTYTGTHYLNNGEYVAGGNAEYELYIVQNDNYRYNNNTRIYLYWTYANNIFTFTQSGNNQNNDFNIWHYGKTDNGRQGDDYNNVHTGVFGNAVAISLSWTQGYNQTTYTVNDYNYTYVSTSTYIDYSNNTYRKNNLNMSYYMMVAMEEGLSNDNIDEYKGYIKELYKNNTNNTQKNAFINALFNLDNDTPMTDKEGFIEDNLTLDNYNVILENISDESSKTVIVNTFANTITDYSNVLLELLKALYAENADANVVNKMLELISSLFAEGADKLTQAQASNLTDEIVTILNSTITDPSEKREFLFNISSLLGNEILEYGLTNDLLSKDDYITLICAYISEDITLLTNNIELFNDDVKNAVSANIIKNDNALFKQYIYSGSDFHEFLNLVEAAGLDIADITDNTGIYALASSHGIENGLFIPDNISLIDMDIYTETENGLVNDPTWRGGTEEDPDYYSLDKTDTVNYKVYYTMKQLKKSIATTIFKMELVDGQMDENGNQSYNNAITNNIEIDYNMDDKVVNFYVPINNDIMNSSNLYINMIGGKYELAYKASFDNETDELNIKIPTYKTVGMVLSDTFVVQAEDNRVKTEYTCNVVITAAGYLEYNSIRTNGANSGRNDVANGTTYGEDTIVTNGVNGYNGTIDLVFNTYNLINGLDLSSNLSIYKTSLENKPANFDGITYTDDNLLENGTDYKVTNGIVDIPNTEDTGFNSNTNGYDNGTVTYNVSIDSNLPKGIYVIKVYISADTVYNVLFEKLPSNNASLISLTYNGLLYERGDGEVDNNTDAEISKHKFGTIITEADLTLIEDNKPSYLDDFVIASLATFDITNVTFSEDANSKKIYTIEYLITAEDRTTTSTFTHYITEDDFDTDIEFVYLNGGVVSATSSDANYIYESSLEKDENPTYRFDFALDAFYTADDSEFFSVVLTDEAGNLLTDNSNLNITVQEGEGFTVDFLPETESETYVFKLVYSHSNDFNDTISLEWEQEFGLIKITKQKNRNSYLDNITFISESVVTSIRTMISVDSISLDQYDSMLKDPTREIVCLPGKIYYNDYDYVFDGNTITEKQSDFYVIGLVDRTQLEYYSPTFDLPDGAEVYRTETINGTVYKYVPYINSSDNSEVLFLVSDNDSLATASYKDSSGIDITVTNPSNTGFTYNGVTYTISPNAGSSVNNSSLMTDFVEFGSYDETNENFKYVNYRVYAEIYEDTYDSVYYTDYCVSVQDLTNNIKFNIIVNDLTDVSTELRTKVENVFVEMACYADIEGVLGVDYNTYPLYNKVGFFNYFDVEDSTNKILKHETIRSNTSGKYEINVNLPTGYGYNYTVTDAGTTTLYTSEDSFIVTASIVARTISINIDIVKLDSSSDDWGVTATDSPLYK